MTSACSPNFFKSGFALSCHSIFLEHLNMNCTIRFAKLALCAGSTLILFAGSAFADCTAGNQATYNTCIGTAATSCAASVPGCDSTLIRTTNSAAIVTAAVTKCCAKSKSRAQLSCASAQLAKLNLGRSVIPATYTEFRRTSAAAIKELRTLIRTKTLCNTGSN